MTVIEAVSPATGTLTVSGATIDEILAAAERAITALFPGRAFRVTSCHATPYVWADSGHPPAVWIADVAFEETRP